MAAYPLLPTLPTLPNLSPPTMDQAGAVDFRTFFPYTPNEVKHRKRTTSAQLKVLETVFRTDTKPNAALRQKLANELEMTPRGVQVWFQNRRAKEKLKAGKAAAAKTGKDDDGDSSPPLAGTPEASDLDVKAETGHQLEPFNLADAHHLHGSSPPPHLQVTTDDSANSSYQSTPLTTPDDIHPSLSDAHLYGLRRGSLPTASCFPPEDQCTPPPSFDPFARRASVDASLHRLATNPYAPYARNRHLGISHLGRQGRFNNGPSFQHRPSMPALSSAALGASPSPLSPYYAPRKSLPESSLHPSVSRPLPAPIPSGPLPQPGFSFGAASSSLSPPSGEHSDRSSPDNQGYQVPADHGRSDSAAEDDFASLAARSRFSSIASTASNGSGYYSDLGNGGPSFMNNMHRRASSTSLQVVGLMSDLNVNGDSSANPEAVADTFNGPISGGPFTQSPPLGQDIQNMGYSFPPDGSAQMFSPPSTSSSGMNSNSPPSDNSFYYASPPGSDSFSNSGNQGFPHPPEVSQVDFPINGKYPDGTSNPSIFDSSFPANGAYPSTTEIHQDFQSFAWNGST